MPAATAGARRKERCGRAGTSHPAQLRSRPPRASTSIPRVGTQAFGTARRPVSNSDTLLMRPSAGCPASTWSAPGGHTGGGGSRPPGRGPHILPLHSRSARPDPAASPQRPPPKISRGEKIFHGGGHAVLSAPAKTFLTGGRVCKDPRAMRHASHACAQSWHSFAFQRRFFSVRFCHNSRAVLRLWQE